MRRDALLIVASSVLLTLLALAPIAYMAYHAMPPQVATVDLQKLIEEQQAQTVEALSKTGGASTDEQRQAFQDLTVAFAKKLSIAVDALGAECHCVIVNKAAVLAGLTNDYTDAVRERMKSGRAEGAPRDQAKAVPAKD